MGTRPSPGKEVWDVRIFVVTFEASNAVELDTKRVVPSLCITPTLFAKSIKPADLTTSQLGYVRLHGRNYQDWFRDKAPRDDRYNYLYSAEELEPWITRIKEIAAKTKESYVITNNHFRGQAVVNALEIKATLKEERVLAPPPLFRKYPALAESARPEVEASEEPRLFS